MPTTQRVIVRLAVMVTTDRDPWEYANALAGALAGEIEAQTDGAAFDANVDVDVEDVETVTPRKQAVASGRAPLGTEEQTRLPGAGEQR